MHPDNWVVLKITHPNRESVYKILAGWTGGYLDGSSWRLNSGVVKTEIDGDYFHFYGESGSVYICHKDRERLSVVTTGTLHWMTIEGEKQGILVEVVKCETMI